jgi:hypothetical protein
MGNPVSLQFGLHSSLPYWNAHSLGHGNQPTVRNATVLLHPLTGARQSTACANSLGYTAWSILHDVSFRTTPSQFQHYHQEV